MPSDSRSSSVSSSAGMGSRSTVMITHTGSSGLDSSTAAALHPPPPPPRSNEPFELARNRRESLTSPRSQPALVAVRRRTGPAKSHPLTPGNESLVSSPTARAAFPGAAATATTPPALRHAHVGFGASRATTASTGVVTNTGRVCYDDGSTYSGQWLNGRQHGYGTCAFASGNVYMGEWRNGVINGRGVMLYGDGSLFDGNWSNGACDGEGVFFPVTGEAFSGSWQNGVRVELYGPVPTSRSEKQTVLINISRAMAFDLQDPDHHALDMDAAAAVPLAKSTVGVGQSKASVHFTAAADQREGDDDPISGPQLGAPPQAAVTAAAAARSVLFAAAGPSYTSEFNMRRFVKYFVSFLVPFLSVPHITFCPLRTNILDLEREYVVSGAALRVDFDAPVGEVYLALILVSLSCVTAITARYSSAPVYASSELSLSDVVIPFIMCVIYAMLNASYQSHRRVAHALERLDRYQYPKLAKFTSSCVDGTSRICVATWDDDGENVVYTAHYGRRWTQLAILEGLLVAACQPVYRSVNGANPWTTGDSLTVISAVASFISIWLGIAGCTYFFMKCFDVQRQMHSRMCVISRCAYLGGQSVLRPTDHREISFALDTELDFGDFTKGFVGWYTTRCFAMYASTGSNHAGRMTTMSTIMLGLVLMFLTAIGDGVYAVVFGYTRTSKYFTEAHLIGLVLAITVGSAQTVYLYVCHQMEEERRKHVYLTDVAAAYHLALGTASSRSQGGVVKHCRDIIRNHDMRCKVLSVVVTGQVIWLYLLLQTIGTLVLALQLAQWVAYRDQ